MANEAGQRVRAVRVAAGLSRADLASKLGVSASRVADLEAGRYRTSLETLWSVAEATGADPHTLDPRLACVTCQHATAPILEASPACQHVRPSPAPTAVATCEHVTEPVNLSCEHVTEDAGPKPEPAPLRVNTQERPRVVRLPQAPRPTPKPKPTRRLDDDVPAWEDFAEPEPADC